ncbi:MAG TPA: type II methionyl aminopeptidase [Nanoarchaeota archaeon]|nr:type II methionyl aminopeptidase [Nanoarchaeota archaeon]
MEKEILEKYKKAGEIAKEVMEYAEKLIIKQLCLNVFELAEKIEAKILELGGKPAFPVNISINEIAAHYTPCKGDNIVIKENDYVKVDIGVHVDGYIADTAKTFRIAGKDELIKCSEEMLKQALKIIYPGIEVKEIGRVVSEVAESYGFRVVTNLTGHGLERYNLHAGITIPNIPSGSGILEKGKAYAIEPFCTTGQGAVKDSNRAVIFMLISEKPVRMPEARKIIEIAKSYKGLPFAKRWLEKEFNPIKLEIALNQLVNLGVLHPFYILKEVSNGNVAQAEHTVIVDEKPIITTT